VQLPRISNATSPPCKNYGFGQTLSLIIMRDSLAIRPSVCPPVHSFVYLFAISPFLTDLLIYSSLTRLPIFSLLTSPPLFEHSFVYSFHFFSNHSYIRGINVLTPSVNHSPPPCRKPLWRSRRFTVDLQHFSDLAECAYTSICFLRPFIRSSFRPVAYSASLAILSPTCSLITALLLLAYSYSFVC
jgi:hypothetical protein